MFSVTDGDAVIEIVDDRPGSTAATGLVCCVSICNLRIGPASAATARAGPSRWHTLNAANEDVHSKRDDV
jgi:hypothetical protein